MIVERVADFADCVAQRLRAATVGAPDFLDKRFPGDQLAGARGQAQQNFYCFRWHMLRSCPPGNQPGLGVFGS